MRPQNWLLVVCAVVGVAATSAAADPVKHRIMFAEYGKGPNRLVELDADGKVTWEHKGSKADGSANVGRDPGGWDLSLNKSAV